MIKEITIGKKYKVKNGSYTRTPVFIHNEYVFYEHDCNGASSCSYCDTEEFMKDVEETPETPEEWFEVFFKVPTGDLVRANLLFKSKKHFLDCMEMHEGRFEIIKLRKVEL